MSYNFGTASSQLCTIFTTFNRLSECGKDGKTAATLTAVIGKCLPLEVSAFAFLATHLVIVGVDTGLQCIYISSGIVACLTLLLIARVKDDMYVDCMNIISGAVSEVIKL